MDDLGKLQIIAPWQESRHSKIKEELRVDGGSARNGDGEISQYKHDN